MRKIKNLSLVIAALVFNSCTSKLVLKTKMDVCLQKNETQNHVNAKLQYEALYGPLENQKIKKTKIDKDIREYVDSLGTCNSTSELVDTLSFYNESEARANYQNPDKLKVLYLIKKEKQERRNNSFQ